MSHPSDLDGGFNKNLPPCLVTDSYFTHIQGLQGLFQTSQ